MALIPLMKGLELIAMFSRPTISPLIFISFVTGSVSIWIYLASVDTISVSGRRLEQDWSCYSAILMAAKTLNMGWVVVVGAQVDVVAMARKYQ